MNNIRVDIRLRPIRFGFLVRPDDQENILEIFRINTCLWGGMFNPIIPFFESVPSGLESESFRFENPKEMINGYLDFFEPDFLVEAEEGLAREFGFGPKRVLQITDILERLGGRGWDIHGLSVHELYWELYRSEFRFESRHSRHVIHVEAKESTFGNFVALNFGSFLLQKQLDYFGRDYKRIFDPEHIILDAAGLLKLYKSEYTSALEMGCTKFRVVYNERFLPTLPTLFILDPQESKDLIDFWNFRAVRRDVKAIPIQWVKELSPDYKEFIQNRYGLMFSNSISDDSQDRCKNYLHIDKQDVHMPQIWFPPIWKKSSKIEHPTGRPTLEADRKWINIQIDEENPEIRFDSLFPEFTSEIGSRLSAANIVRLEDWNNRNQIATVFPYNYKNPELPRLALDQKPFLPTTEGLVMFPEYQSIPESWNLVDGTTAFTQWFKANKIPSSLSDAGRATQQIIQTLGGCREVSYIAHKDVIEFLNKISNDLTKTTSHQTFQEKLGKSVLGRLIKRKVVELGLNLKCSRCSEWNWYSLAQLDYSLTCGLCLKQFDFPVLNPKDTKFSKWAYRLIGPFAQPDYAKGGYTSSLAIRVFACLIGLRGRTEATWSAGQELELTTGKKVEVDFMLWYQTRQIAGPDPPPETVFGEAKSFGKAAFKKAYVDNMKLLAQKFPGSILVFATMREGKDLSKGEINRIKKLAEWGREYDEERKQTRAPVIVLTGTELFTTDSLEFSWEEKGKKHKSLIESARVRTRIHNLRVLADLTQQLYLGMPPYESSRSTGETTWFPAEPGAKKPEED